MSPSFHLSFLSPSISSYVPTFHNVSAPCLNILRIVVYFNLYVIFVLILSLCSSTVSGHPSSSGCFWPWSNPIVVPVFIPILLFMIWSCPEQGIPNKHDFHGEYDDRPWGLGIQSIFASEVTHLLEMFLDLMVVNFDPLEKTGAIIRHTA